MNRTISILALMIAIVAGVLYVGQRQSVARLREENDLLRQQLEKARVAASKVSTQATDSGNELGQSQFSELLRLRGEVTQLRELTNTMRKLREENEKLQAGASVSNNVAGNTNSEPGQEIHERDSWAFAGYNSPENSFQSTIWAYSQTNRDAFLAGFDTNSDDYAMLSKDTNFEQNVSQDASKMKSFQFAAPAKNFDNFSLVSAYVDDGSPKGQPTDFLFRKNGDSWQLIGIH